VALVVPPGEIAVGSTTNCFGAGLDGNVVGVVGVVVARAVVVVGLVVAVGLVVVVGLVAVRARCPRFGFGRLVVVVMGCFFGLVVDVVTGAVVVATTGWARGRVVLLDVVGPGFVVTGALFGLW
jgi:hypothetical protein